MSEIYDDTREEQEDRNVEECREGIDDDVNIQPLECHRPEMSLASAKKVCERVRTAVVLHEPAFTDNCTLTGAEMGEEAGEPKVIDRNRGTSEFVGDCWVGYVRQL